MCTDATARSPQSAATSAALGAPAHDLHPEQHAQGPARMALLEIAKAPTRRMMRGPDPRHSMTAPSSTATAVPPARTRAAALAVASVKPSVSRLVQPARRKNGENQRMSRCEQK